MAGSVTLVTFYIYVASENAGIPFATIPVTPTTSGPFTVTTTAVYETLAAGQEVPAATVTFSLLFHPGGTASDPIIQTLSTAGQPPAAASTPETSTTPGNGTSAAATSSSPASTSSVVQTTSTFVATSSSAAEGSSTTSSSAVTASTSHPVAITTKHGISAGATAGAAVGCFIVGGLLAALLTWLFLRSRNDKKRPRGGLASTRSTPSDPGPEKPLPNDPVLGPGMASAAAGAPGPLVATGWEQHLPQSESDHTLRQAIKTLFDQIELHVGNFYRDTFVSMTPAIQSGLMKVDSAHLPDSVAGLLPKTKTPTLLIKHCLAARIVSHITADGDTTNSFLPSAFIGRKADTGKPAFTQAHSRWRILSSYLHPPPADDRAYLAHRDATITACADTFCSAFQPWANGDNFTARRTHLLNIMKSASETGLLIFSQASGFAYIWDVNRGNRERGDSRMTNGRIVILPAFVKISGENVRKLVGRGLELVEPIVGTL